MKKSIFSCWLVAVGLIAGTESQAQLYGHFGHVAVGYDGAKFGPVNDWMPFELGYPSLKNNLVSIGLDHYSVINNVLVGIQLQSKVGNVVRSSTGNMRPYVFDGMIQAGYVVFNQKKLIIYPTIGAGYGAFGNHLFNTRKKYPDFVPDEPSTRENVVFINRGFVGSLAVSADYYVRQQLTERNKGFVVGLRVGYDFRPKSDRWQANGKLIEGGGPEFAAAGPFVRLLLGLGKIGPKVQ